VVRVCVCVCVGGGTVGGITLPSGFHTCSIHPLICRARACYTSSALCVSCSNDMMNPFAFRLRFPCWLLLAPFSLGAACFNGQWRKSVPSVQVRSVSQPAELQGTCKQTAQSIPFFLFVIL
jgi:hypothetical protein